jgi:hypothetical protein
MTSPRSRPRSGTGATSPTSAVAAKASRGVGAIRHAAGSWNVLAWHNRFRKLLTRFEKHVENYLGLVHLACFLIVYRQILLG